VRVWETPTFFAEYQAVSMHYRLGRRYRFNAAHWLHDPQLSPEENRHLYGKCGGLEPHGHTYLVEVIVSGALDPRTETAYDLGQMDRMAGDILSVLDYADLDGETAPLRGQPRGQPRTGENLAAHLGSRFTKRLGEGVSEVRLRETPDYQFGVTSQAEVSDAV